MKSSNNRSREKKGVAGIIAALFLILIFSSTIIVYYVANQQFDRAYQDSLEEFRVMQIEKDLEQFEIEGRLDESNRLLVRVNNTGSIPITIVRIFLIDPATGSIIINPLEVSMTLNPGAWDEVNTNYEILMDSVLIKVLTQRGNVKSNIYPPEVPRTGEILIGPFLLSLYPSGFNYTSKIGSIDQYQVKRDGTSTYYEIYGKSWAAQSFVPDRDSILDYVDLRISVTSTSAASLVVEIRDHDAVNNRPGSIIVASYTISATLVPTSASDQNYADNWVNINTNPILTGGTKYWLVLHQLNNATTYRYRWYYSTDSNSYTNGEREIIPAAGGAWTSQTGDFMFKTYRFGLGPAFAIPSTADKIVFHINITNISDRAIAFSKISFLVVQVIELNPPHSTMINEDEVYFHIMKDSGDPLNPSAYSPDYSQVILGNGGSTILIFGAKSAGSAALNSDNCLTGLDLGTANYYWSENFVWTFFVLSWKFVDSDEPYTQTIAYTAIRVLPS